MTIEMTMKPTRELSPEASLVRGTCSRYTAAISAYEHCPSKWNQERYEKAWQDFLEALHILDAQGSQKDLV